MRQQPHSAIEAALHGLCRGVEGRLEVSNDIVRKELDLDAVNQAIHDSGLMLVILAGLGGYLYVVEFPTTQREVKQEAEQKQLLSFPETAITGLAITTAQGPVELTRTDSGSWTITAPLQADADIREVQALVRALVTGRVTRSVAERSAGLAPFGLEQPVTTVTVTAGGQQDTLAIGDSGPLSNTLYVLRGSDGKVLLTDLAPKDFVNKSLELHPQSTNH